MNKSRLYSFLGQLTERLLMSQVTHTVRVVSSAVIRSDTRRTRGPRRMMTLAEKINCNQNGVFDNAPDAPDTQQDKGEFLFGGRIVPVRREGNTVYYRSLRPGEQDPGKTIPLQKGDRLVFEPGALVVSTDQIDTYSSPGLGGYAPVANTIWTWYRIVSERVGFVLFLFSLARRTDAAHALWASAMETRNEALKADGIPKRHKSFIALATAEMAIIALHRCTRMVHSLVDQFCPELEVPDSVNKISRPVEEMRHAFEHIDDRAMGKFGPSQKIDPVALTIFDQPDFLDSAILQYRGHTLDLESDVIGALLDCRKFIMAAIDDRASQTSLVTSRTEVAMPQK